MSTIRILPEILSNKIAAGEVVERPASVVKELVENAIDAGSTRIAVEIEQGGRKLIRVSDNGHGMGRDDALLSLERYATSKIAHDPDLFAIRTLGFRGEALPSIASVSRFILTTRQADADVGTCITVAGGRIEAVTDVGAPPGSMVSVGALFYNTPARRKFLKSAATETGHIADTIASMALCRPAIQFRLSHNDRLVKSWASVPDPADRVADVLGSAVKSALCPVEGVSDAVAVSGWVAAARLNRSTARGIYLFVNGRWVKDRVLRHALFAGYAGRLMKGQYPVAVLFLAVPFDQVDVNVHPAKHEIRFAHQKEIHDHVRDAVTDSLRRSDPASWKTPDQKSARSDVKPAAVGESRPAYLPVQERDGDHPGPRWTGSAVRPRADTPETASDGRPQRPPLPEGSTKRPPAAKRPDQQSGLWRPRFFSDLTRIGQYRGTYIICQSDDGLVLIDQHAAHERIVFEQLKHRSDGRRPAAQRLLLPETIDLGFREAQILERIVPELARYGLEIEPFGGNTFVVKAMPVLLDNRDVPALVTRLVEKTAAIGVDAQIEAIMEGCLMIMACHNAIRAHQRLSDAEIEAMLGQLDACENPSHCPHGRPIWIQWTLQELEKRFRRIV
jgi:DNA mismatch repair protein MutL